MLQRSEEWNRIRASAITASACAAVLDRSPWTSRTDYLEQKAFEKVYGIGPRPSNPPMEEGIDWEPRVIEASKPFVLGFEEDLYYADNTGKIIDGVSTEYQQHPDIPFIGASPDKLIYLKQVNKPDILMSGLEVKKQFRMSKRGPEMWFPCKEVSFNYWCQCQLSMEVFNVETWHFFVLGQRIDDNGDNVPWQQHELVHRDREWFEESLVEFVKFFDELEDLIAQLKIEKAEGGGLAPKSVHADLDEMILDTALGLDTKPVAGLDPSGELAGF
jgi:hypothetical protein